MYLVQVMTVRASAIFSAIAIVGALVLPEVIVGMIDASIKVFKELGMTEDKVYYDKFS